jgi:(1->4)-alpha-D-glucan 1-alpha-D-glucosylmutase
MRIPSATYRLQITEGFTLSDATAIVPYLAALGVSDIYLSPVFEARPGSRHGYDVTDPIRIRAAVGGESALRELSEEASRHGMGILLDIVPNHMAASVHNPWWRDVLECGRRSRFAHFFDIDWGTSDAPRRLRLPLLGEPLDAVLSRGEITIDAAASEVVYYDTRLPLAAGTVDADPATLAEPDRGQAIRRVLDRQHYELVHWRTASEEMNYRRFFDITDLAGVRVELEDVFDATHALVRTLAAEGVITGLRIDHVDGLRDPTGYLARLRRRVHGPGGEPVYTVVEKILERDEHLPSEWACEGTTGYEFLTLATGLLIDPAGHGQLEAFYSRVTGDRRAFGELVREKKLLVMDRLFGGELTALARSLVDLAPTGEDAARAAVAELTASMSVYRTYTHGRTLRDADRARIEAALEDARLRNPRLDGALRAVGDVVLLQAAPITDAHLDWVMRWQQFTGPVMAKGFEDTALYCHNALLAANDVGTDPGRPAIAADELHAALADRFARSPRSLNATATHDTKRGEDTRARIAVLSEVPDEWRARLRRWIREGDEWKAELADDEDAVVPDADVDSLLYQTLLGAWPLDGTGDEFTARVKQYMTKAVREAKEQTSWRRPDEDYEQALHAFIDRLMEEFGRAALPEELEAFAARLAPHGALNSLAQLLLKITAPGIPDMYQGTELWSFTLVDPDNRQPVDYTLRSGLLEGLRPSLEAPTGAGTAALLEQWEDGRVKLLFTALALRLRTRREEVFERGDVVALSAQGPRADQVLAFARTRDDEACIVVLPRWTTRLGSAPPDPAAWAGTTLPLPARLRGSWTNALTGEAVDSAAPAGTAPAREGAVLDLAAVFRSVPFALLEQAG